MYRNILVPIDETDLTTVTIGRAVEFAKSIDAHITFFYGRADISRSFFSDAALMRVADPMEFEYAYLGRAEELLAKAASAARALGVRFSTLSEPCDQPHKGIVEAAAKEGCDLIFMASHGRRSHLGVMLGSQTLKVLMNSAVPVLVSTAQNPSAAARAIGVIRDEHRSLAAVLNATMQLLGTSQENPPDHFLLRAIVQYIHDFPVELHHPKEDEFLFSKLRQRTRDFDGDLDVLQRQHDTDRLMVGELAETVERYCSGTAGPDVLERAFRRYSKFVLEHMGREESLVLPGAERYLSDPDWEEILDAFSSNQDPRFGGDADAEYKRLFSRIVNLVPRASGEK